MDFPGYIGGLVVGETHEEIDTVLDFTTQLLPEKQTSLTDGCGAPDSLIDGVIRGVDMFDCVLPAHQLVMGLYDQPRSFGCQKCPIR